MKVKRVAVHPDYPGMHFDDWEYIGKRHMRLYRKDLCCYEWRGKQHFARTWKKVKAKDVTFKTICVPTKFERKLIAIFRYCQHNAYDDVLDFISNHRFILILVLVIIVVCTINYLLFK